MDNALSKLILIEQVLQSDELPPQVIEGLRVLVAEVLQVVSEQVIDA